MSSLPPRRQGFPAPPDLVARRAALANAPNGYASVPDVVQSVREIGGVRCVLLEPSAPKATILHFHGGGFRLNTPDRLGPFASHVAALTGCRVVLPSYGLAPEQPFPAALHDGEAVLNHLASVPLIISGDSAGGNLAIVLAQRYAASVENPLLGLLLFSPWTDLTLTAASYEANASTDTLFSRTSARDAAALYLQSFSAQDPLASPGHGDLSNLPETLILTGCIEVLLDDSIALAAKIARCNIRVAMHAIPGMAHVAATLDPEMPGAREAFDLAIAFIRRRVEAHPGLDI